MSLIETIEGIEEVQKELLIVLGIVFFSLMPIGFFLAKLSIEPMKKSLESIDEFVNGIIHDLNTPLSIISINAQSIPLDLENRELIREKSSRILQGIKDIESLEEQLMLSLKADRYELSLEEFDMREILLERENYWKSLRNAVDVVIDADSLLINGDRALMIRMVDNLVSNGVKFSHRNGVVEVSLKGSTLKIRDDGVGIRNPNSIFEKYYREDHKKKGLGLGLHIVNIVAKLHKIPIKVDSKETRGSVFIIDLSSLVKK